MDVIAAAWDERVVGGAPGVEETVEVVVTVLRDSSGSSRSERKEPHSLVVEDDIVIIDGEFGRGRGATGAQISITHCVEEHDGNGRGGGV